MARQGKRKAGDVREPSNGTTDPESSDEGDLLEGNASDDEGALSDGSEGGLVASSSEDEGALASEEEGSDPESDGEGESDEENEDGEIGEATEELAQAVQDYYLERDAREGEEAENGELVRGQEEVGVSGRGEEEERRGAGEERFGPHVDESDSSEDERPDRNTVGNVPLEWYKDEEHIGYTKHGKKIIKQKRKDELDKFLKQADDPKAWRTLYDEYNDEDIVLSKEEIAMIQRIRQGKIPHAEVNPHEPYVDWFEFEDKGQPLSGAPEPKRRFIPSKWEAKQVVKIVRAIRKGWISFDKKPEAPRVYLLWEDDFRTADKTANGLTYIPPPKPKLPGHEESYNPPLEYLPTEEELNSYDLMYEEDRPKYIPRKFDSLRQVPSYANFVKDKFERCLDLYLSPRIRKKRINIDPESLIPKLPKPKDLQPFPTTLYLEFLGHEGAVRTLATDPSGQWLASGSRDGTVRLWEVQTGRCRKVWSLNTPVKFLSWNPNPDRPLLAVVFGRSVLLMGSGTGNETQSEAAAGLVKLQETATGAADEGAVVRWQKSERAEGLEVVHKHDVAHVSWHHKGDYFASTSPDAVSTAVLVHQLGKQQTQNPFRKNHGRVQRVLFHPTRPFFFVATQTHVRVYNLAKQQLAKKLTAGVNQISSMAIHSGGDNLIIGSYDNKLTWFDMDLSTKPYRTLRYHDSSIEGVAFHRSYPLFASCSDDGSAHVFHGMVYSNLLENPLIVPVKILRGHKVVESEGVLDCAFHPTQPWLFTAGADKSIKLYCN
ncbi:WD40 repeat nucleolar protein Bop1 [Klebsormidium nitens]|uniref:Ribosome biogenesis protein BOP1 homolog n=1 Tax=Klebsormidium nitens TaxID=105231 RepID=A0A1Y1I9E9_KLENI|nr:WD40 repeat nucleolar protein Bop1 [Klebsormidium nitens]|eukprot:GAQ87594.1 WD40 repeat nucleolar protein Bop1 [Klebsormidium nitens]